MSREMEIRSGRDFGLAIAESRAVLGLSQRAVAEDAAIERSYLTRLENGLTVVLVDRVLRVLRRLGAKVTVTLPEPPAVVNDLPQTLPGGPDNPLGHWPLNDQEGR